MTPQATWSFSHPLIINYYFRLEKPKAESGDECDLMEERSDGVVSQEEEDNLIIDPESDNDIEDHDNRQGYQRLIEVS